MIRHTGLNLGLLKEKIERLLGRFLRVFNDFWAFRVNEFYKTTDFLGRTGKYEEFQEQFMEEYNEVWRDEDYWLR